MEKISIKEFTRPVLFEKGILDEAMENVDGRGYSRSSAESSKE